MLYLFYITGSCQTEKDAAVEAHETVLAIEQRIAELRADNSEGSVTVIDGTEVISKTWG